jgi:two-component system response regulator HydG
MKDSTCSILIIDDDPDVLTSARLFLKQHFTKVKAEPHPRNVNQILSTEEIDVVLLDMNFTKGDNDGREGLYWLTEIKQISPETQVILMTAYGDVELAVDAIKKGATDFVLKPWKNEKLLVTINTSLQLKKSNQKVKKFEQVKQVQDADDDLKLQNFIGDSQAMREVFNTIDKVGKTDANVLILGENGTGKTLVALALHKSSLRQPEPFVHVDLGAINENLFESELFGHKKGSFTDAYQDKAGRFEVASGGSLFLDEIGNLQLHLQAKLLTALQSRKFMRLGDSTEKSMNVRLICATNMPVHKMVDEDGFRQDLLYRINTVEITLPPLRDRLEDIPVLTEHFLKKAGRKYGKPNIYITKKGVEKLKDYHWPGNIRELEHTIERLIIMSDSDVIDVPQINLNNQSLVSGKPPKNLNLEQMEKYLIEKAIHKHSGNISKAAKDLGLTRAALYRRMEKYEI